MMNQQVQDNIVAQGGGYGPPPGGYGQPPGGMPPGGMPPGAPPAGAPPGAPAGMPPGGAPMAPPGGAPMAAPGGGPPPGAPPPAGGDMEKTVGNWFIISVISIFCWCGLLGIIPTYLMHTAKQALQQGDMATVEKNLKNTKICIYLGIAWMVFAVIAGVVVGVILPLVGVALI